MCRRNNLCCSILTLLSIIVASIGISAIFYEGLITSIIVLVYIALVLGIASLIFILFFFFCRQSSCRCINDTCLINNSIISIILSIFALTSTSLATFSIPVALLIGSIAFVFLSNIASLIRVISCFVCEND